MRQTQVLIIFLSLFVLVGCSGANDAALASEQARLFTALHAEEVVTATTAFDEDAALAFGDLARGECPASLPEEFSRTVLSADNSTLVLYTDNDHEIVCTVFKPAVAPTIITLPSASAPSPEVALTVNGETIAYAEIQGALDTLPNANEESVVGVVNTIVNVRLLEQEAKMIDVDDEQVALARGQILASLGGVQENATETLTAVGRDSVWLDDRALSAARVDTLLRERLLLDDIAVTEGDAQAAYLADPNRFVQGEQAVARLLFVASEGRTVAQGEARAQEIAAKVPTEDFCALVKEYSEDERSREQCGVYVLPRGVVDARLEMAAFTTGVNQTAVVVTDAGIYFVQTLQVLPASVVPYADVAGQLQESMRVSETQARLALYLDVLRSKAEIVSYLG